MKGIKKTAWDWCSKYIRLRDAIEFQNSHPEVPLGYVACCTCGAVKRWQEGDAGHWINRGHGGMSGVYFDERNIHFQCKTCNGGLLRGTMRIAPGAVAAAYDDFMLTKYGLKVIEELHWLDINQSYRHKLYGIAEMYKQMYFSLCAQHGISATK